VPGERWHRNVIRPSIDVDLSLAATGQAGGEKRAHAAAAHVAKCHRADWFVRAGHRRAFYPRPRRTGTVLDVDQFSASSARRGFRPVRTLTDGVGDLLPCVALGSLVPESGGRHP
jgi:hypothetical protein